MGKSHLTEDVEAFPVTFPLPREAASEKKQRDRLERRGGPEGGTTDCLWKSDHCFLGADVPIKGSWILQQISLTKVL